MIIENVTAQELVGTDDKKVEFIGRLILEKAVLLSEDMPLSLLTALNDFEAGEGNHNFHKLIQQIKSSDESQLVKLHSYISCTNSIIKLFAVENWRNQHNGNAENKAANIILPEELLEKSLRIVDLFININILRSKSDDGLLTGIAKTPESRKAHQSASSRSRGGKGARSQESKADSFQRKLLLELVIE